MDQNEFWYNPNEFYFIPRYWYLLSSYLKIIILIEMTNITYVVFGHWSGTFFKVQAPQTSRLFIKNQTFLM